MSYQMVSSAIKNSGESRFSRYSTLFRTGFKNFHFKSKFKKRVPSFMVSHSIPLPRVNSLPYLTATGVLSMSALFGAEENDNSVDPENLISANFDQAADHGTTPACPNAVSNLPTAPIIPTALPEPESHAKPVNCRKRSKRLITVTHDITANYEDENNFVTGKKTFLRNSSSFFKTCSDLDGLFQAGRTSERVECAEGTGGGSVMKNINLEAKTKRGDLVDLVNIFVKNNSNFVKTCETLDVLIQAGSKSADLGGRASEGDAAVSGSFLCNSSTLLKSCGKLDSPIQTGQKSELVEIRQIGANDMNNQEVDDKAVNAAASAVSFNLPTNKIASVADLAATTVASVPKIFVDSVDETKQDATIPEVDDRDEELTENLHAVFGRKLQFLDVAGKITIPLHEKPANVRFRGDSSKEQKVQQAVMTLDFPEEAGDLIGNNLPEFDPLYGPRREFTVHEQFVKCTNFNKDKEKKGKKTKKQTRLAKLEKERNEYDLHPSMIDEENEATWSDEEKAKTIELEKKFNKLKGDMAIQPSPITPQTSPISPLLSAQSKTYGTMTLCGTGPPPTVATKTCGTMMLSGIDSLPVAAPQIDAPSMIRGMERSPACQENVIERREDDGDNVDGSDKEKEKEDFKPEEDEDIDTDYAHAYDYELDDEVVEDNMWEIEAEYGVVITFG